MKKRALYEGFIKNASLFATIDEYELTKIVDAVKPVTFKAGSSIIKEGDQGDTFYLLENGEAYATKTLTVGQPARKVMEYKKSMYFGELALLKNTPRAANVVAKVGLFFEVEAKTQKPRDRLTVYVWYWIGMHSKDCWDHLKTFLKGMLKCTKSTLGKLKYNTIIIIIYYLCSIYITSCIKRE